MTRDEILALDEQTLRVCVSEEIAPWEENKDHTATWYDLSLLWYLQAKYGAACILTNAEWGEKMALAVCQGVDSGPPAPLGIALCRLLLMLVERDKQEQSVIVEGNNGT